MLEREIEIAFTHPHKDVCTITAYLLNPEVEMRFALHVPMTRLQGVLDYLSKEVGRNFVVKGDEADAIEAEVTIHDN